MIDVILNGLKEQIGGELQNKAGVSSNMMDDILKITGSVATKEVSKQMLSGNLDAVMNLFSNQANNAQANSLQDNIVNGMVTNFVQKLGLNKQTATTVTTIIIPVLMNLITKKNAETPDNDPSPLNDLFNPKGKGGSDVLGGLIGKTLGGLFGK
ncbi:MAG: hypothetical protein H6579_02050 [Chitinophagales bacterium]|nr:hypothetical protein [Bacteroidota bacterium]MCB9255893.1 hypothetical protein [Chitinophagales bacterium]